MPPPFSPSDSRITHLALGHILIAERKYLSERRNGDPNAIAFDAIRSAEHTLPADTAPAVVQAIKEITDAMRAAWTIGGQFRNHEWDTP